MINKEYFLVLFGKGFVNFNSQHGVFKTRGNGCNFFHFKSFCSSLTKYHGHHGTGSSF